MSFITLWASASAAEELRAEADALATLLQRLAAPGVMSATDRHDAQATLVSAIATLRVMAADIASALGRQTDHRRQDQDHDPTHDIAPSSRAGSVSAPPAATRQS